MALKFAFEKARSPIFGTIYRPVAKVLFFSPTKRKWYEVWMIIDTGADYTLLPKYFSKRLGINLVKDCKVFKTAGIGGIESVYLLPKIKVKLGRWELVIPVGFLEKDNIPPLMGRHLFFETFDVQFSKKHVVTFKK